MASLINLKLVLLKVITEFGALLLSILTLIYTSLTYDIPYGTNRNVFKDSRETDAAVQPSFLPLRKDLKGCWTKLQFALCICFELSLLLTIIALTKCDICMENLKLLCVKQSFTKTNQ